MANTRPGPKLGVGAGLVLLTSEGWQCLLLGPQRRDRPGAWTSTLLAETKKGHFSLLLYSFFHKTGWRQHPPFLLSSLSPPPLYTHCSIPGISSAKLASCPHHPAPGCAPTPPSKNRLRLRVLSCLALCPDVKAQTSWRTRGLCVLSLKRGPPLLFSNSGLRRGGMVWDHENVPTSLALVLSTCLRLPRRAGGFPTQPSLLTHP